MIQQKVTLPTCVSSKTRQRLSGCCLCHPLDGLPPGGQLALETELQIHQEGHRHAGVGARRGEVRDEDEEKRMKHNPFLPAPAARAGSSRLSPSFRSRWTPFWQQRTAGEVKVALQILSQTWSRVLKAFQVDLTASVGHQLAAAGGRVVQSARLGGCIPCSAASRVLRPAFSCIPYSGIPCSAFPGTRSGPGRGQAFLLVRLHQKNDCERVAQ